VESEGKNIGKKRRRECRKRPVTKRRSIKQQLMARTEAHLQWTVRKPLIGVGRF